MLAVFILVLSYYDFNQQLHCLRNVKGHCFHTKSIICVFVYRRSSLVITTKLYWGGKWVSVCVSIQSINNNYSHFLLVKLSFFLSFFLSFSLSLFLCLISLGQRRSVGSLGSTLLKVDILLLSSNPPVVCNWPEPFFLHFFLVISSFIDFFLSFTAVCDLVPNKSSAPTAAFILKQCEILSQSFLINDYANQTQCAYRYRNHLICRFVVLFSIKMSKHL